MTTKDVRQIIGGYLTYNQMFAFFEPTTRMKCVLHEELTIWQIMMFQTFFPRLIIVGVNLIDMCDATMILIGDVLGEVTDLTLSGSFFKLVVPSRLKSIKIEWCPNMNDISALSGLCTLVSVDMSDCEIDFNQLVNCHNLRKLIGGTNAVHLPSFEHTSLRTICLSKCPNLISVGHFSRYIKCVKFSFCEMLRDMSFLRNYPNIRKFKNYGSDYNKSYLIDYNSLGCNMHLRRLEIDGYNTQITCFSTNAYLHYISITGTNASEFLRNKKQLRSIELNKCDIDWKVLEESCILSIRTCKMLMCQNILNFRVIGLMENLRVFELYGCDIDHISDVAGLMKLENVSISDCPNLESVEGLRDLVNLRSICIENCHNIGVLPFGQLKKLKSIFLREMSIVNLDELWDLENICNVNLIDCQNLVSVNGLCGSTGMKRIAISGCDSLICVDVLEKLWELEYICVRHCGKIGKLVVSNKLGMIECVTIENCYELYEIVVKSDVKHCEIGNYCRSIIFGAFRLNSLRLIGYGKLDLNDFRLVKGLQTLELVNCSKLRDLNGLCDLSSLKEMIVHKCDKFLDRCAFRQLKYLDTSLKLVGNIFADLADLRKLKLSGDNSDDEDVYDVIYENFDADALTIMVNLEILELGRMNITNVSKLEKLKRLKKIVFYEDCKFSDKELEDVELLKKNIYVECWY